MLNAATAQAIDQALAVLPKRKKHATWYNVWAQGTVQGATSFSRKPSAKVLVAKFRARFDAEQFSDAIKRNNPTWTVVIQEGR